ncbi:GIY-YIG nuclease family protein [Bordetella bronchiseptica]
MLKEPGGKKVDVHYHDWWLVEAPFPCLYVGKATNLRRRFRQHLLSGTAGRAHQALSGNFKTKPRTSSCQLSFELNVSSQPNRIRWRLLQIALAFPGVMSSRTMLSRSDFC